MMGINTANLKTKLADPKVRTLVVFVGVLVVALVIYLVSRSSREAIPGMPTVASGAKIPGNIESVAGQNPSKEYNALQAEANRRQADEAIKEGGTAVASILHTDPQTDAPKQEKPKPTGPTPEEIYRRTLAQQQANEARQQSEAARQQVLAQQVKAQKAQVDADSKAMSTQAKALLATWTAVPGQAMNIGPDPKEEREKERRAEADKKAQEDAKRGGPVLIRSGDILFATLDSEVDTDDGQGVPVLATIVQGPFKGARILGSVTRQDDRAILQFNTMNAPFLKSSIAFNAIAVNPETARAAMASEVNHHYLQRYGSLFAASFLQGWGQSVQDTSTFFSTLGGFEVNKGGDISARKQIQIGLGQVGQAFGTQLQPVFNRPPTVKIHSGTGMGILVLQDVREGVLVDPAQLLAQQQMQAALVAASNRPVVPQQQSGVPIASGVPVFNTVAAPTAIVVPAQPVIPPPSPR